MTWYSLWFFTATMLQLGDTPGFMHRIHLVFHEAGHALLFWAPRVLMVLGGTLGQIAMPLALTLTFAIRNRDAFGAAICGWWTGHAILDAAPYINDARATRLMLLGGGTGDEIEGHDWNFLLEHWGILSLDIHIARVVLLTGRLAMVLALLAAAIVVILKISRMLDPPKTSTPRSGPPA